MKAYYYFAADNSALSTHVHGIHIDGGYNSKLVNKKLAKLTAKTTDWGKIMFKFEGKYNTKNSKKTLNSLINKQINYVQGSVKHSVLEFDNIKYKAKNINGYTKKNAPLWAVMVFQKSDIIKGSNENDILWGYKGNDKIIGNKGNDVISGGAGNDNLWGGGGKDIFKASKKNGKDTIWDFKKGQDKIHIGSLKKIKIKKNNYDTLCIYSQGKSIFELEGFDGNLKNKGKFIS